jgi:hypothetical protein
LSGKFKLCDLKLLLADFKKHKINCIFHFTFLKQLKPIKVENGRESKKVRENKNKLLLLKKVKELKFVEIKISPKKMRGVLKCSKFQAKQLLFYDNLR